jgi:hypothetical protein
VLDNWELVAAAEEDEDEDDEEEAFRLLAYWGNDSLTASENWSS